MLREVNGAKKDVVVFLRVEEFPKQMKPAEFH